MLLSMSVQASGCTQGLVKKSEEKGKIFHKKLQENKKKCSTKNHFFNFEMRQVDSITSHSSHAVYGANKTIPTRTTIATMQLYHTSSNDPSYLF